jgi:hypothetical protein
MNFIFWAAIAVYLSLYIGIVWAFLTTIGIIVSIDLVNKYLEIRKEERIKKIREENVLLSIEVAEHKDQWYYLIHDVTKNVMVKQANTLDEIVEFLVFSYKGKMVLVQKSKDDIVTLADLTGVV